MIKNHNKYIKLAFNLAKINFGKIFKLSVGCIVKNQFSHFIRIYINLDYRPYSYLSKCAIISLLKIIKTPICMYYGTMHTLRKITTKKKILIINKINQNFWILLMKVDPRTAKKLKTKLSKKRIYML